jgi:hypothetical protein
MLKQVIKQVLRSIERHGGSIAWEQTGQHIDRAIAYRVLRLEIGWPWWCSLRWCCTSPYGANTELGTQGLDPLLATGQEHMLMKTLMERSVCMTNSNPDDANSARPKCSSCSIGKIRNEQKARTAQGPSPDCERLRAALNIAPSSKFGRAATRATTRAWTCILNHPTRRRHSRSKATSVASSLYHFCATDITR